LPGWMTDAGPMLNIPRVAKSQFGAFTVAQAGSAGITSSALKHAVSTSYLTRLRRGVYCATDEFAGSHPRDLRRHLAIRSAAAVVAEPGAVASHRSAAALAGLPILSIPDRPCITVQPRRHSTARGLHVHRARFELERDVVRSQAIDRTSTSRTVADIARECGVDEAVVVADAAIRRGRTDASRLHRELEICASWPGVTAARIAVSLSDGRSESPFGICQPVAHRRHVPSGPRVAGRHSGRPRALLGAG
jgi:predicted transcriptional regulator of viral defense system